LAKKKVSINFGQSLSLFRLQMIWWCRPWYGSTQSDSEGFGLVLPS